MKLIADSGSTKTQWMLMDVNAGKDQVTFSTAGINPLLITAEELENIIAAALDSVRGADIDEVHYYGAGCVAEICPMVEAVLRTVTKAPVVEVASDMLGAARGLCGKAPGIVAILGTGSNSCYYDGEKIAANTPPLGYIIGDEGSGARLGAALVNGVLKRYLPEDICRLFETETGLDKAKVIERVYRCPGGNAFLASLVPFIAKNIDEESLRQMVVGEFGLFFKRNIAKAYPSGLPVNFVGSVAVEFQDLLKTAAAEHGIGIARIVRHPLKLMAEYHRYY